MIVTKKALPRRTFLRGMGATLALPLLDGMMPAFAAPAASKPIQRLGIAYVPNGIIMESWTPAADGALSNLTPILAPLEPFRDQLLVLSGLATKQAIPYPGEGTGDHVRAAATFLTGVHPKKTEGPDIRAGVSMDQIAARELGRETQLASLELCLDANELIGACEAGYSCAYANTLSWRDATSPLPMENQPRAVFERLFGQSDDTSRAARLAAIRHDRSILDSLVQETARFRRTIGPADKQKLEQYLESIRDIERRIQKAEQQLDKELPEMDRPSGGIPGTFAEHARLMFDMQLLAYQSDMTRVVTFMLSREVSPRPYPEIGISDPHHGLSHHGNNPKQIEKLVKLNTFHMTQFAYFLNRMKSTPDGDGTLLDHTTLLYGCGISNSNEHVHTNLPILVAGGTAAGIKGGRHLRVPIDSPVTNLHLSMLDRLGIRTDVLGDSTGQVEHLSGI